MAYAVQIYLKAKNLKPEIPSIAKYAHAAEHAGPTGETSRCQSEPPR